MAKKTEMVEVGTGNVFKDLGFADADERKLRAQLAMRLNDLIKERKLRDVEIVIRPKAANHAVGLVSVLVAA